MPAAFTSESLPTGHTGTLEYQWQLATDTPTLTWDDVEFAGTHTITYGHVGTLTQTTWFRRLARVDCMGNWDGAAESNVIKVTVHALPEPTCPDNQDVCIDAPAFALSGATPVGGTYSGPGVTGGNFNPSVAGVGTHTISYTVTENGCTNTCTFTITVNDTYEITFNAAGGEGGEIQTVAEGVVPTPPVVTREGHTFMGWTPEIVAATADATYTAQWEEASLIGNPIAHFKADGLPAGPIGTWTDTSGSGNHVTQSTPANQPTVVANVLNGLSVVRFDGNDNMKKGAFTTPASQPNTIFIVWKSNATGFRFAIGGGSSSTTTNAVYQGTGGGQNIAISGGSILSYNRTLPFQFLTTTAIFNGANSKIYENGVHRTTGDAGSNSLSGLVIGSLHNDDRYLIGDIAEILIYNSALSDTDREAVEEYLRDKWFRVFVYDGTTNELKSWHATIQGGINAAAPGDLVEVTAGTYYESLLINKPITIQGAGIGQSIIDGSTLANATALVRITGINFGELLFDGFTIQNTPLISTGGNRNPVMIHACDHPAKITFSNNRIIGSGVEESGVNQWGLLVQFSTAEFVVNQNTFDGIMNNAILVERAVGPVELGYNTFNVPDYHAGPAI